MKDNDDEPMPRMEDDDNLVVAEAYEAMARKAGQRNTELLGVLRKIKNLLGPTAELGLDPNNHAPNCPVTEEVSVSPEMCICTIRPILLAYREIAGTLPKDVDTPLTDDD